jgi:Trk K+ transport system NAD-binding subunit
MSFPNIPDVDATIDLTTEDAVNLLLASIAFEELGLAHLINAEAEKIQYVLGTLETTPPAPPTIEELLEVNRSVDRTLRNVIKKEMLLQFKLEDTLSITPINGPVDTTQAP